MKLSELIDTLQKTDDNRTWGVDLEKLGSEFGLSLWGEYYEGDELTSYYHQDASWVCTDTRVGVKLFFLNDKLICISTQRGRKSDEIFLWTNAETKNDLFSWLVKNFVKNDGDNQKIMDINEDVSKWIVQKQETEELNKKYLTRHQK